MFIYRFFKRIIFIIIIAAATLYIADYQYNGKTVRDHVKEAYKSGLIAEGYKDLATWFGELFKFGKMTAAEKIVDKISDKDKSALENVIKNELKDNITKMKEEAEKTEQQKK